MASAHTPRSARRGGASVHPDPPVDADADAEDELPMGGDGGPEDADVDADTDADTSSDSDAMVGGSNVRVIVRVRPLLEHEVQSAHSCSLLHIGDERVPAQSDPATGGAIPSGTISVQAKESVHRFSFDAVLAPHHSQRDVFEAGRVAAMLRALLKGYHGTIFGRGTPTRCAPHAAAESISPADCPCALAESVLLTAFACISDTCCSNSNSYPTAYGQTGSGEWSAQHSRANVEEWINGRG